MKNSVLVVGGTGYIGSHMVKMLIRSGHQVTVFDNLSRGNRDAVGRAELIVGNLLDPAAVQRLFDARQFDAVMHFAALAYVGESVEQPARYYQNNVAGTLNLLDAMLRTKVDKIVFSSTCATYGNPITLPITEEHPQNPINPYGESKLMVEKILGDYAASYGLRSVALRYFNAAGSDLDGELGERHDPETHLIPLVLQEALRIKQGGDPALTKLCIYGDDFDTPDGTCIRDYIHVQDLCSAHLAAMNRLMGMNTAKAETYNLGNGSGFSVKEIIDACCRVTGTDIRYKVAGRRAGDPACLVGGNTLAKDVLGWQAEFTMIDSIIETAWRWVILHNKGCENAL